MHVLAGIPDLVLVVFYDNSDNLYRVRGQILIMVSCLSEFPDLENITSVSTLNEQLLRDII